MPKCFNPSCKDGIITVWEKDLELKKVCKKCEKFEKDLMESEDYEITIVNGKPVGYELIDKEN